MINRNWVLVIVFSCSYMFLFGQVSNYPKTSLRLGFGYGAPLVDNFDQNNLEEVIFYGGLGFAALKGKLRITPSLDLSFFRLNAGQSTNLDLIGVNMALIADYDIYKFKKSALFLGIGASLQSKHLLLRTCMVGQECEYFELGSDSGKALNLNFGYRYLRENSKVGFEILGRVFVGDIGRWIQTVFLVDLKLR